MIIEFSQWYKDKNRTIYGIKYDGYHIARFILSNDEERFNNVLHFESPRFYTTLHLIDICDALNKKFGEKLEFKIGG